MKKRALFAIILCLCVLATVACGITSTPTFTTGDLYYFGHFQDGSNVYPLEWRVISTDTSAQTVTLLANVILDEQRFDSGTSAWDSSSLKTWMNTTFLNADFSSQEQKVMAGSSGSKVALLTESEFTSLTSDKTAGLTVYSARLSAPNPYYFWLEDEGSGSSANAMYVNDSGTQVEAGAVKTTVMGVRPVIKLKTSGIQAMIVGEINPSTNEHQIKAFEPSVLYMPYVLAFSDPSLPTLSVTGYDLDDSGLTINVTPSQTLSSVQRVYCYLKDSSGKEYIGWSGISSGKATFTDIPKVTLFTDAYVLVGAESRTDMPSFLGNKTIIHPDPLKISGIQEGQNFLVGNTISFNTKGSGMSNTSPSNGAERIIPYKWELTGGQTGTWSPTDTFTAQFTGLATGSYTLNVYNKYQVYNIPSTTWSDEGSKTDEVRTVHFTVSEAAPTPSSASTGSSSIALTISAQNNRIYTNGRVVITPAIKGGEWKYDTSILSLTQNADGSATFRGLKAGTATITYTVGWASNTVTIQVEKAVVPSTGQDFTPVAWLLVCAAGLAALAILSKKLRKKV